MVNENRGVGRDRPDPTPKAKKSKPKKQSFSEFLDSRKKALKSNRVKRNQSKIERAQSKVEAAQELYEKYQKAKIAAKGAGGATAGFLIADALAKMQYFMMMMLLMMKGLITSAIAAVGSWIMALFAQIQAAIAYIAGLIGATVQTVVMAVVSFVVAVVVGVASIFGANSATNAAQRDAYFYDCAEDVEEVMGLTEFTGDVNALQIESAKKIYSVYKTYGLRDEQIAGVLGNWSRESGIDPTGVEGVYGEKYHIGPKKAQVTSSLSAMTNHVTGTIWPALGGGYSEAGYRVPGGYIMGMGLGQWTGSNAQGLLNAAKAAGQPWFSLDFQISYLITPGAYREDRFRRWRDNQAQYGSVSESTDWFCYQWEGIPLDGVHTAIGERRAAAANWFLRFAEWEVDTNYANSIIAMAGAAADAAAGNGLADAQNECAKTKTYDNSSLAKAAVAYAHPNRGYDDNGTELFQYLNRTIFPSADDTSYQSCDAGVSVAVRWAGADDNYPHRSTEVQQRYLFSNPHKWEHVADGRVGGFSQQDLLPGDILIRNDGGSHGAGTAAGISHTEMYVGIDLVREKYPDAPANRVMVAASYGDYSPGAGNWYNGLYEYHVFRNIQAEQNPKYINVATGFVGNSN